MTVQFSMKIKCQSTITKIKFDRMAAIFAAWRTFPV